MSQPRAIKCDVEITFQCPHCKEWNDCDDDDTAFNGDQTDLTECDDCGKEYSFGGMAATANHSTF